MARIRPPFPIPGYENLLLNFDPSSTGFVGVNASTGQYQNTAQTTNTLTNFTVPSGSNRKLVLIASWENGNQGISATWNGTQNFTAAVNSTSDRNAAILYLDAPTAGTGNIVVSFSSLDPLTRRTAELGGRRAWRGENRDLLRLFRQPEPPGRWELRGRRLHLQQLTHDHRSLLQHSV
jgi:hypothetical protein